MNNSAYIALGSNKGDRFGYLKHAIGLIDESDEIELCAVSSVYESKAYGIKEQSDFLNAVIMIKTGMEVRELLSFLKDVEKKSGRSAGKRWGPREIDLDLLFYNKLVLREDEISVPHPGIQFRDFVVVPLSEIAPELIHPVLKIKVSSIKIGEEDRTIISKYSNHLQIKSGVL
ncbi:MAG: 2-amino-4-hydroxy-6-hydroxymethyldihydropteridine diphosphokinase [Ignavibacteriaceae bacterium]